MKIRGISSGMIRPALAAGIAITTIALPQIARADESGISFWIPGLFGSLGGARNAGLVNELDLLSYFGFSLRRRCGSQGDSDR